MKITFETPKEIVIVKEIKRTISEIIIEEVVDNSETKTVTTYVLGLGQIILWSGDEYDAIGEWTDADVVNRVNELYK